MNVPRVIRLVEANPELGHGEEVTISLRARSWENASDAMLHTHEWQPLGYSLIAARISRRGKKGGRRCELHLVLRHTDDRIPSVSRGEWAEILVDEAQLAEGIPVHPSWKGLTRDELS